MAKYKTLTALFTAIATSLRGKTGGTEKIVADDFPSVIDSLSTGGITPTGTKTITSNGTHDVTSFATAKVEVPASGITPSGEKTITANGTHDVTSFASALVNVQGLHARIFTATVSADVSSGAATISGANDWIASIRSNANAFILVRYLGVAASTTSSNVWLNANFAMGYSGSTKYNTIAYRQSASTASASFNINGLTGDNYGGHLTVQANGSLIVNVHSEFPVKAGTYQIIAGTLEMV